MRQDTMAQPARLLGLLLGLASLLVQLSSALEPQVIVVSKSSGIVVPKRPALIAGLDQQFRGRQGAKVERKVASSSPPPPPAGEGLLVGHKQAARKQQSALYLDRQQQELLAANPNLSPAALSTRSDPRVGAPSGPATSAPSQSAPDCQAAGQQLYRGFSLIELEVRSDSDRRFVQELYGNLSAALDEQAQRPNSVVVSPYADIDFWSFKTALNDQIDIMVSPKSRAFILNQLNRAKIKHRLKIDDIQTRLDAQQLPPAASSPASSPSLTSPPVEQLSGRQLADHHHHHHQQQQSSSSSSGEAKLAARQQLPALVLGLAAGPADRQPAGSMNDSLFFENYQRLNEINQYLESIVARARDVAKVQVIGRSSQGRYLRVLRLGHEQRDVDGTTASLSEHHHRQQHQVDSETMPQPAPANNASRILEQFFARQEDVKKLGAVWLDGGTHAREWISPATVLYMAFRLSDNHARCLRFFDYLRVLANQASTGSAGLQGRSTSGPNAAQLDADLLNGINEINTSLLGGGQPGKPRMRTELEQKLELLAKRPQEVASEHACDLDLEQLLRRYTFYIMPVLNPDGYEYSHTHNRLWRKTRSTSNHPIYRHFCLGADPNRNYDARHGQTGSSSHPCSQTYGGTTPFTEPETRHQSNFVYAHRNQLKMFISFHSYSQMILLPFSHSKQLAPDHKDLESVGLAAVKAIERTHGTQYRVGPSASILYTASGTASDWAYEKAGIKYSYTIELRDTGTYGFLLPRQQIIPTGEETFNGLLAMINQMDKNDNLLTSKSSVSLASSKPNNATREQANFVHAPDLDQLRPFRPRPATLENALDGSDSWATPGPRPPGVRERRPPGQSDELSKIDNLLATDGLVDEVVLTNNEEPDAGYAFEGEGELMEPTGSRFDSSSFFDQTYGRQEVNKEGQNRLQLQGHIFAHSSGQDLIGRQSHQRLMNQPSGTAMSANGRNLINSPPLPSRSSSNPSRRESSERHFVE